MSDRKDPQPRLKPAERMKMREAHIVPLSWQAVTLLRDSARGVPVAGGARVAIVQYSAALNFGTATAAVTVSKSAADAPKGAIAAAATSSADWMSCFTLSPSLSRQPSGKNSRFL